MGNPDRCASSSGTRDNHSFTPKKGSPSRKGHSTSPRAKKASPPRKASPAPESTVLFVEPLSRNVDGPRLYQIFAYFGEVANVEIPMNKTANLPHDYGYIDFKKRADAERALRYMDGGQIDGNDVKVSFVVAPQKQASSSLNAHPRMIKVLLLLKRMLINILGNHLHQEKNLHLRENGLLHIKGLSHPTVNLQESDEVEPGQEAEAEEEEFINGEFLKIKMLTMTTRRI